MDMVQQLSTSLSPFNATNSTMSPFSTTPPVPWHWDRDFEAIVHPHWRQFPLVPEFHHYLVGIYITIVGITGTFGNLLVLYIFASTRTLRTPPNLFIVNLATSDLTFTVVEGFPLLTISSFNTRWAWGPTTCEIYGFIGGLFGFLSIGTMALIAFDRYCVIVKPVEALKRMTYRRAVFMLIVAWIWATAWAIPPFFGYGSYVPEGFQTSCTFDYLSQDRGNVIFNIGMYVFAFCVPLLIIIFCYYKIVKAVREHELEMIKMATKLGATSMKTGDQKSDVKAAKVSVTITLLYLVSWLPYAMIALLALTGNRRFLTPYVSEIPVLAAKTSAVYNPIVYALTHPRFREVLEKKFPWLLCCCPPKPKVERSDMTRSAQSQVSRMSSKKSEDSQSDVTNVNRNQEKITKGNEEKKIPTVTEEAEVKNDSDDNL